jgi:hypothetical protein
LFSGEPDYYKYDALLTIEEKEMLAISDDVRLYNQALSKT